MCIKCDPDKTLKERTLESYAPVAVQHASPLVTDSAGKRMPHCLYRHYKDLTHHSPDSRQPPTTHTTAAPTPTYTYKARISMLTQYCDMNT